MIAPHARAGAVARSIVVALSACSTPSAPPSPTRNVESPPPAAPKQSEEAKRAPVPAGPDCQGAPLQIGVLGLEAVPAGGVIDPTTMEVAKRVTAQLRRCAVPVPGSEKELVDEKLMNNCASQNASCMAIIGTNLGVDHLVFGTMKQRGQQFDVELVLLDVKQHTQRRWTGTTTAADAEVKAVARAGHVALLGSSRDCGC